MTRPGGQHFRDGDELRDMLLKANVSRGRRMVCYDGSGVAAAKLAFALTLLGHDDVAVYDGGWAEWGDRLDLPSTADAAAGQRSAVATWTPIRVRCQGPRPRSRALRCAVPSRLARRAVRHVLARAQRVG